MEYFLIGSITLLILLIIKFSRKPSGFPPGPPRIPVIGTMPQTLQKKGRAPQQNVCDLVQKYGDTIGAYAGNTPVIWLHDPKTIRKLFNMEEFSGNTLKIIQYSTT